MFELAFPVRPGMAGLLALAVTLALAGCGDDGGGDGRGSTLPGFGRWPVPRAWSEGDLFGYGIASFEATSPEELSPDLDDRICFIQVDFVEARVSGGLPDVMREGPCLLTNERGTTIGGQTVMLDVHPRSQLQPLCADEVERETTELSMLPALDICNPTGELSRPTQVPCDSLDGFPDFFRVASGPSAEIGDVVTMLDGQVPRPTVPGISTPVLAGSGIGVWPEGSFVIGWSGAPATAGGVEVVVRRRDDTGPVLRCLTDDTGQLEVPEALLADLRDQSVLVEVSRFEQVVAMSEEIPVRLTYQTRESFHLNGRR